MGDPVISSVPTEKKPAYLADAEFFKNLTEDWSFAAAVACSVQPGDGHGKRRERDISGKVSARKFAAAADTTADRVMRYLRVWEAAALKKIVPAAAILIPGSASTLTLPTMPWKDAVALVKANIEKPAVKPAATPKMAAPKSITEERGHMMEEAKKDVQHIADAAFNLPKFTEEDRDQVLTFVSEMATVLREIKKAALAAKITTPDEANAA